MAVVKEKIGTNYSYQITENPNGGFFIKERTYNNKDFRFQFNHMGGPRIKRFDTIDQADASAMTMFNILN